LGRMEGIINSAKKYGASKSLMDGVMWARRGARAVYYGPRGSNQTDQKAMPV